MPDDSHNLKFSILKRMSLDHHKGGQYLFTLKRLSCKTRLMAASSPLGESFVWKTTPKEPFPTILHCVYARSLVSPVRPSWTFSLMTSAEALVGVLVTGRRKGYLTAHPQS
jgi:hypothetical protein